MHRNQIESFNLFKILKMKIEVFFILKIERQKYVRLYRVKV